MTKLAKTIKLLCMLFLLFSAACSGAAPKSAAPILRIEWTNWDGDYTLLIADKLGYFEKNGVNVEPVRYETSPKALTDLAGLELDGGLFSMSDLILGSSLTNLKGVLVSDNGGVFSIVASSDISKVSQVRGKRIALVYHSAGEIYVTNMLKTGRMTFKDVTYVEMPPDQVPAGIPEGADAGVVMEPYTSQAIRAGLTVVYQDPKISALLPRMLVFRKSLVDQYPELIRGFLLAWNEAVAYRTYHPVESLDIIMKATSLPANDVRLSKGTKLYNTQENIQMFTVNREKDPNSIYHIAEVNRDFLLTNGYLTLPPDLDTLLDPSFLR